MGHVVASLRDSNPPPSSTPSFTFISRRIHTLTHESFSIAESQWIVLGIEDNVTNLDTRGESKDRRCTSTYGGDVVHASVTTWCNFATPLFLSSLSLSRLRCTFDFHEPKISISFSLLGSRTHRAFRVIIDTGSRIH